MTIQPRVTTYVNFQVSLIELGKVLRFSIA